MKIGIITQSLQGNYGGIIQNWALQQALIKLGYDPITFDVFPQVASFEKYIKKNINSLLATVFKGRKYRYHHFYKHRIKLFQPFVDNNIKTTTPSRAYTEEMIQQYGIDALLVGSDQVWRPKYNEGCLEDMFFRFAKDINCPKLSYAASFGTDIWEFDELQTKKCKELISKFNLVSVREPNGITLCKEKLGVDAIQVLDPTLLLEKQDYLNLIEKTPRLCEKPFLAAYFLDLNKNLKEKIIQKANERHLEAMILSADTTASLTMEQWLSIFRDADYIFTDSFHGSVFSFIFGKKFEYVTNETRGASRFKVIEDLLATESIDEQRKMSIKYLSTISTIYELSKS